MAEYKVIAKEVPSVVWRDVEKAALELATDVNADLSAGGSRGEESRVFKQARACI